MSNGSRAGKALGLIFASGFAAVWIVGWSAGTLFFDATFVRDTLRQARSAPYPTVVGQVVESRIDTSSDGESASHTAVIRYAYRVNDRGYECERYRYGTKSATRKNAERVTGSHPVGSAVT